MSPRDALVSILADFAADLAGFLVLCLALYVLVRMNGAWQEWRSDRKAVDLDAPDVLAFRRRYAFHQQYPRMTREIRDAIRTEATQ